MQEPDNEYPKLVRLKPVGGTEVYMLLPCSEIDLLRRWLDRADAQRKLIQPQLPPRRRRKPSEPAT